MTISELQEKAHANNKRRGITGYTIFDVIKKLEEEVHELKIAASLGMNAEPWKYLGESMMDDDSIALFRKHVHSTCQDELADIILVCLAASVELGIDIEWFLKMKNNYNAVRQ